MDLTQPIFKKIYKTGIFLTVAMGILFIVMFIRIGFLMTEYSYAQNFYWKEGGSRDRIHDLDLALSLSFGWVVIPFLLTFFLILTLITVKESIFKTKETTE